MTEIVGMASLERKLAEMFLWPARKPRPCKQYRVPNYGTGRNRLFSHFEEALAHALVRAREEGREIEVLRRVSGGRARCPDNWYGQVSWVQPGGTVRQYWNGAVVSERAITEEKGNDDESETA